MTKSIRAWHFTADKLRDGSPIPKNGKWLKFAGKPVMCEQGLHASLDPFDALQYAPGPNLHLVNCRGELIKGDDKLVCTERRIVASMDATEMLRYFSRMQALSVIHLWDAPDVVCDYLMTGDEEIRHATWDAARGAARHATWDAARGAARHATWDAARGAASAAAWDAACAAAWDAARDAAKTATWDAARDAARKDFNELVNECFWEHV